VGARAGGDGAGSPAPPPVTEPEPSAPADRSRRARLRWWALLAAGIVIMGGAGYLVAALVLFPAPLLPNERQVPRILGLAEAAARSELGRADLAVQVVARESDPGAAAGTVIWQDPPPGVAVPKGATVALTLSRGLPRVAVPDVRGFDLGMAHRLLGALGLHSEAVDTSLAALPSGTVAALEPAPGDSATLGSTVILHLAK